MRRLLLAFIMTILFAGMSFTTAGLGLAVMSPFHSDSPLFLVQDLAEQGLIVLLPKTLDRIYLQLDKLDLRSADLSACSSPECAQTALAAMNRQLEHVAAELAHMPDAANQDLRKRLLESFDRALTAVDSSSGNPQEAEALRALLIQAQSAANDPSHSLSRLLEVFDSKTPPAAALPQTSLPTPTGQLISVSGRMVIFPAGSVGAIHAFFPLNGKHSGLECRACHEQGYYAGTATQCSVCHKANIPEKHYPAECSLCHTTEGWKPAVFDHRAMDTSDCTTCHLQNRPSGHYNGQCSACHSTTAWKPANFNHEVAGATDCASCHGKVRPANHYNAQCSACHSTRAWKPANFNHQAVGAADCASCHSAKRPANHFAGQCSACHSTNGWLPASFNHQAVGATDCVSCHSGRRPANHFSGQCSACHSTNGWLPASFNHQAAGATDCAGCHSGRRPANHFAGQCSDCHSTDSWQGARFNHSFPLDHGGANGQCSTCHPGGGTNWTCFGCHDQGELDKKHNEEGISDYASRCLDCHSGGQGGDD